MLSTNMREAKLGVPLGSGSRCRLALSITINMNFKSLLFVLAAGLMVSIMAAPIPEPVAEPANCKRQCCVDYKEC